MNRFSGVFQKYKEYLLSIQEVIVQTAKSTQDGSISEEAVFPFLDAFELEVDEINDCVLILQHLLQQKEFYGN